MAQTIRRSVTVGAGSTTQNALAGLLFATLEQDSQVTVYVATDNAAQEVSATFNIQSLTLVRDSVVPIELVTDGGPDQRALPLASGAGVAGDELTLTLANAGAAGARVEFFVLVEPL